MKRNFIIVFLLAGLLILGAWAYSAGKPFRAEQSVMASMPPLSLLLPDSTTMIDTRFVAPGKPVVLVYFSPDCEHCHFQTQEIIDHIQRLKDVHLVMLTPMPLHDLKAFNDTFKLSKYKNITLTYDYGYNFYKYFKTESFPCVAVYNKDNQLVRLYRREIGIEELIKAISI
jgi:cytochrome oxidase Cu insertion factor (SCO1/SenC/PrrC family)